MNLFQCGDFKLSSGATSRWKVDCDALTQADLRTLAYMGFQLLLPKRFGLVVGVPKGGLLFAEALREYSCHGAPALIVDDVLTTGGSMERAQKERQRGEHQPVMGLVIFARGPCPDWIRPIFQMPKELWLQQ